MLALWLNDNLPWLIAGCVAPIMSLLRAYLDEHHLSGQDFAEAAILGMFLAASRPIMNKFGISDEMALFVGVVVGFLGVRFLRPFIESMGNRIMHRTEGRSQNGK